MSEFSRCDLTFVCQESWSQLPEEGSNYLRHCGHCQKGVFPVRTRVQFELATALGRCVALTDENEIVGWIGQSKVDWFTVESDTVALRISQPLAAGMAVQLRLAFPKIVNGDDDFPLDRWITIGAFSPQLAQELEAEMQVRFPECEIQKRTIE